MTTPGDGGNEIELIIKPIIEDAENAVRSEGERQAAAFREGVESVGAAQIRPPNTDELYRQYDAALIRLEARFQEAARNMGLALQEGSGGSVGLFGDDLRRETDRFRREMEDQGGAPKTTFVGTFAQAVENDNRLLQAGFDRTKEITERGRAWALNAEGRTFLSENPGAVPVGGFHGGAAAPGDLDRLNAAAQKALSRVVVDEATYSMENGEFFKVSKAGSVLRAQGPIADPELQGRLATAVQNQMAQVEAQVVQDHLREIASRPGTTFSQFGIDPTQQYGLGGSERTLSGSDIAGVVDESGHNIQGLTEALTLFKDVALEAPQIISRLEGALVGMMEKADEAARAAEREALATQDASAADAARAAVLNRLQAAYAGDLPNRPVLPDELHGLATPLEYQQDQIRAAQVQARQAEEEARQAAIVPPRPAITPYVPSADEQATQAAERAARAQAIQEANAARIRAAGQDPEDFLRRLQERAPGTAFDYLGDGGFGGRGGPPRPPAPGAAGFPGEDPEMRAAMARLEGLYQITQAQIDAGRLTGFEKADAARAGSRLDGQTVVGGGDDQFFRVKATGTLEEISQADALARARSDLAETTRVAAQAEEQLGATTERSIRFTGEESAATLHLIADRERLAAAIQSQDPGQIASARDRLDRSSAAVAVENAPAESRTFLGSALHAFGGGDKKDDADNAHFRLNADNGQFLGAIARYQAAYAVIFGLSQAFHSVLDEEEAVGLAMIQFGEATGLADDKAERLAETLAGIGSRSGLGAAAAIEAGTKGAFAFADETTPGRSAGDIATTSVQATAVAALITQAKDASVVQGQLIAVTRSFNLTVDDQSRVLDAAANAARHYGTATGEILAGLPGVAGIAHQAGLSVEETANIISVAAARTAQTGTAVSTAIGRVLENINSKPQTKSLLDAFGVDTTGTAGQTLESLASHWKALTTVQQDQVIASLGGVRAAKDLIPVLQEGDNLVKETQDSYKQAGYAQELYYRQLNTLAGVLKTIGGDINLLGHDLATSHLFDLFGAALKAVDPFLVALDDVLKIIGGLDNVTHGWLVPLLEVAAVLSVIAKHMATIEVEQTAVATEAGVEAAATTRSGIGRLVPAGVPFGLGRGARAAKTGLSLEGLTLEEGGALAGGGALTGEVAAGTAATSGGLAALGGALLGPLGVVAGLIGMAVAIGAVTSAMNAERQAHKDAEAAQRELRTAGSDPGNLRSAASALNTAAIRQEHANSGFGGAFAASEEDRQRPDQLRALATYANQEANRLEAEQRRLASTGGSDVFFTHTADFLKDFTNGLSAMNEAAVPAVRQLQLITDAINGLSGRVGTGQAGVFNNETTVGGLVGATQIAFPKGFLHGTDESGFFSGDAAVDPKATRQAILDTLAKNHVEPGQAITPDVMQKIADAILVANGVGGPSSIANTTNQGKIDAAITTALSSVKSGNNNFVGLTQDQANTLIQGDQTKGVPGLLPTLQQLGKSSDPRKLDSTIAPLQLELGATRAAASQVQDAGLTVPTALIDEIHKTEADLVKAQVARLERLRTHAASTLDTPEALAAAEAKYVEAEARAAIANDDPADLLSILDSASKATLDVVRASLAADVRIAQAAFNKANAAYAEWLTIPAQIRAHDPELRDMAPDPADPTALNNARHVQGVVSSITPDVTPKGSAPQDPDALALSAINARADSRDAVQSARIAVEAAQYTFDHAKNQTERNNARKQLNDANHALDQAITAQTQAVTAANVRQGDPLSAATNALHQADTALQAELHGTTAWYTALGQFRSAQYAYGQALLAHQHELRLNGIDQTDPVAVARENLRAAQATLARDQHDGTGDLAADRNAVATTNAAAQAAAFSQRFQDIQTSHNLGTLSDQAYLAYLNSEHNRLQAIHNRTRQQTEELQQIDGAIKAAADQMQGQWNIGTIRIPTPYEARRYIQASGQGQGYGSTAITNTNNNTFSFAGLSKAEVLQVLKDALGAAATQTTATTARKV